MFFTRGSIVLALVMAGCTSAGSFPPTDFSLKPVRAATRPSLAADLPSSAVGHPPAVIVHAPPEVLGVSQAKTYPIAVHFEGQYDDQKYVCRLRLDEGAWVEAAFTWGAPGAEPSAGQTPGARVQVALEKLGPIGPGEHVLAAYLAKDGRMAFEGGEPRAAAARFRVVSDAEAPAQPPAAQPFGIELCPGGCSMLDGDGDGIADDYDGCPAEQETVNGFEDGDGCPDPAMAELAQAAHRVVFANDSAQWKPESTAALKALAALLRDADESLGMLELVVRPDARGSSEASRKLAQKRADAVRRWLAAQSGVTPDRISAVAEPGVTSADPNASESNRRLQARGHVPRRTGLAQSDAVPELKLPSGWSVQPGADGAGLEVVGADASHYTVYALVRSGERTALYGRTGSGREADVLLGRAPGEPVRAVLRERGPVAIGGSAAPIRKQWSEAEAGAPAPAAFAGPARACRDCVGPSPVLMVHQPQPASSYRRSVPLQFAAIAAGQRLAPGGLSLRVALQGPGLPSPRIWDLRDTAPLRIDGLAGPGYGVSFTLLDSAGRPVAASAAPIVVSVQGEAGGAYASNPCPQGSVLASGGSFAWTGPGGNSAPLSLPDFCVDARPVTMSEYDKCVASRRCPAAGRFGQDDEAGACHSASGQPALDAAFANCVSWKGAAAYCRFVGKHLATEAEWAQAARVAAGMQDAGAGAWEWTATPFAQTPGGRGEFGLAAVWGSVTQAPGGRTLSRREHEPEGDALTTFRCVAQVVVP